MRVPRWVLIAVGVGPLAAIFALLIWGLAFSGGGNPGGLSVNSETGEVRVVKALPAEFSLTLFDGTQLALSDLLGRAVMLDFWASWCVPCRVEAETLEAVWRQYRDRNVVFVGIAVWDSESSARDFVRRFGTSYPVGTDPRGSIAVDYGVTGIPEKYFINTEGRIVRKLIGPMNEERLSRVLDQLLAGP